MTREQFIAKAVRAYEKSEEIPPGWWGNYRNVWGPAGQVILQMWRKRLSDPTQWTPVRKL